MQEMTWVVTRCMVPVPVAFSNEKSDVFPAAVLMTLRGHLASPWSIFFRSLSHQGLDLIPLRCLGLEAGRMLLVFEAGGLIFSEVGLGLCLCTFLIVLPACVGCFK